MHKYFTAADWGIVWPVDNASLLAPPPPVPNDHGFLTALAPVGVLFAIGVTIGAIVWTRGMIGDTACAWRLPYSPAGRAFSIWGLIFLWSLGSCVYQLLNGFEEVMAYTSAPWVNLLEMGAWLFSALWVVAFSGERGADPRRSVTTAAFFLVAAMLCAVGAVSTEDAWRNDHAGRIIGVGVPQSILAGWLCVAAAASIGIVVKAWTVPPDTRCRNDGRIYSTLLAADPIDRIGPWSWVPLGLAVAVSAGSFVLPDPVFPLPVAWGVWNMRGHLKNWLALELLITTAIAASVAVAVNAFVKV